MIFWFLYPLTVLWIISPLRGIIVPLGVASSTSGGGGGCSDSLDFSDPCNSMYVPVLAL